jgi:hypothetical protein
LCEGEIYPRLLKRHTCSSYISARAKTLLRHNCGNVQKQPTFFCLASP